jgi:hypothetical protein
MYTIVRRKVDGQVPLFRSKASKIRAFEELRLEVFREKDQLNEKVEQGKLDEIEFATKVNDLVARYMESAAKLLSPKDFEEYFGQSYQPGLRPTLVDPEIAALNRHR